MKKMQTIKDLISKTKCDNYLIYRNNGNTIPVCSFYRGYYTPCLGGDIEKTDIKDCTYKIEKDKIFKEETNLLIYIANQVYC